MTQASGLRFGCDSCGATYAWKAELAGRKAKCKCGEMIAIPTTPSSAPEPEDLYDVAPTEPEPPKKKPRAALAPIAPSSHSSPAPLRPLVATAAGAAPGGAPPPEKLARFHTKVRRDKRRRIASRTMR